MGSERALRARQSLQAGGVIPAQPLALTRARRLDERRQRALVRYHIEAGVAGLAAAVHSTQFSLHDRHRYMLEPLLRLVAETGAEYAEPPVLIAGVTGETDRAVRTAELAATCGYDFVLLSNYGCRSTTEVQLLERAAAVADVLPVIGFYLQPAVGGIPLSADYWRRLVDLPNVVAVKVAPFDRYATQEVFHGVAQSSRSGEVALYTGNDDSIISDLVIDFPSRNAQGSPTRQAFVGGLLGQWAMWTRRAVETYVLSRRARAGDADALSELLRTAAALTDANGAIFDARNGFRGVIPGVHEILRRHGFLDGIWLLDEGEALSPGQMAEIDRIWESYPTLRDDDFIAANLDRWLS